MAWIVACVSCSGFACAMNHAVIAAILTQLALANFHQFPARSLETSALARARHDVDVDKEGWQGMVCGHLFAHFV